MSKLQLDDETLKRIDQQLADLSSLQHTILSLAPDFISIKFKPESYIPVAAVCLLDTLNVLEEARYALHESLANLIRYREKANPPNEMGATFLGRFYVDDAAIRLYSAAEHLANAIIFMLEIEEGRLKPYQEKRTSQQSAVGAFLRKEGKDYTITEPILKLGASKAWNATMKYRNVLVHEQPPTVQGFGIVYKRYRRWKLSEGGNSYVLGFGGGDEPDYSIEDLLAFVQPSFSEFVETLNAVVQYYIELLKARGITITLHKGIVTL